MNQEIPVIAPFCGVRYNLEKVRDLSHVTAPPYDVISEAGQKALYERDPYNVVRLILGMQFPTDNENDNRYTRSAQNLQDWLKTAILVQDSKPAFYLYEQFFEVKGKGPFLRRGFLALRKLEPFGEGQIRPHEKTLAGPKEDRLLLMKSCSANLSPIFSLYSDPQGEMTGLLNHYFQRAPMSDFTDEEGVRHRLWRVDDRELFLKANEVLGAKPLFIADGHHRYETAMNYRNWVRSQQPDLPENSAVDYVMMYFSEMADPGLLILPTHRVLQSWPGFEVQALLQGLQTHFEMERFDPSQQEKFFKKLQEESLQERVLGMALKDPSSFYLLRLKKEKKDDTVLQQVDTAILHRFILQGILKMSEEQQKDPQYMRFVKDAEEALKLLNEERVQAAFLTTSLPMEVLKEVTDAGVIMPPKTTFFYPKLASGLVMNQIDPRARVSI